MDCSPWPGRWDLSRVLQKAARPRSRLAARVGEFGIAYAKTDYQQPWFDENGGVYPVYHAIKGLAELRGRPLVDLVISKPRDIQAIAAERDGDVEVWIANLTDQTETVELVPNLVGQLSVLSASEFERATQDFSVMDSLERAFSGADGLAAPVCGGAREISLRTGPGENGGH